MRVLLDTSYLFDFMDRPGMFLDSERRVLAVAVVKIRLISVAPCPHVSPNDGMGPWPVL